MRDRICVAAALWALCLAQGFARTMEPGEIFYKKAQKLAIYSPTPIYPLTARRDKVTGSGVVLVKVDSKGIVTSATMRQSTGSPILDNAATSGFKRWRFKPGQAFWFRMPITFTMAGYQF